MANKSLIDMRKFVPEYFGNNREFQVFLRAVNLAFSVIKSDTDNFIPNLLNPLKCKARLLPLLSNYVGWDYNPRERVVTNRWITKLYPLLVRNRGNELGLTLAIAMSVCLLGDPEDITFEKTFSMEMDTSVDKYGRKMERLKIYMYIQSYLPILKDLIEVVRPAGVMVEFIPAQSVNSTETISLTDEYSIMKYDYITGKLLSINNVDVYIQNSWKVLVDEHAIKHYKWKDLQNFVWGRISSTNSDDSIEKVIELSGTVNVTDLNNDLINILSSVQHYKFNSENVKEYDNVKIYTLEYLNDSNDKYFPPTIVVTVTNDEIIDVSTILYTNNEEYIRIVENLLSIDISPKLKVTRNKLDVASDYTWGYLQDTGIEQYAAIPGLAPYEMKNKGNLLATIWNTSGVYLTDGRFYDKYNNDMGKYVDAETGKILLDDGTWNGEFIKETRIYIRDSKTGKETYTGMYFDVSEPAKVLNTYYKLLDDGVFSGFFLSKDDLTIYNGDNMTSSFRLREYTMNIDDVPTIVWKVYDSKSDIMYNWHVDMITRKFVKDNEGLEIKKSQLKMPFSDSTYIGKKAFLMKKTEEDGVISISATKYYVNLYGDIVDPAGNIILSKKDRYKVSDSTMIGFSEVHDTSRELSTYDGTNILQREWSFMKDDDIPNIHGKEHVNDFEEYERIIDPRYKFDYSLFDIGTPIREYTGTELIRFVSNDDLQNIKSKDGYFSIPLFITSFDSENASGELKINMNLPENYSLADVFKNLNIRYENILPNDELNPKWDIYIDWTANEKNKSLFNLNDLENPIHFIKKGIIEPRTLHWTGNEIKITPKMYDGTTKVYSEGGI